MSEDEEEEEKKSGGRGGLCHAPKSHTSIGVRKPIDIVHLEVENPGRETEQSISPPITIISKGCVIGHAHNQCNTNTDITKYYEMKFT